MAERPWPPAAQVQSVRRKENMPLYPPSSEQEREQLRKAVKAPGAQYSLRVYRALERDLVAFERHVPLEPDHLKVFSLELWSVIVRACAEIDSQLHALLNELQLASGQTTVASYKNAESTLELSAFEFRTVPGNLTLRPFEAFARTPAQTPDWWQDYNAIKHNRLGSIKAATYENALAAVAGVAAVLYRQWGEELFPRALYTHSSGVGFLAPFPSELLSLEKMPWQRQ